VLQSLLTINQLAGPAGFLVAGSLFAWGLHAAYAVIAALGTVASLNFVSAVAPLRGHAPKAA
jgi:hypothetical protein